jgi:hypothetical protein
MQNRNKLFQSIKEVHDKFPLNMDPIKKALGNKTPDLGGAATKLSRLRLQSALKIRYGEMFRNHPDAKEAIESFDNDYQVQDLMRKVKGRT